MTLHDSNTRKSPEDWKTGEEPMTGAQRAYLETLSTEAGEGVPESLTKAEASEKIDELRREKHVVEKRESAPADADASNTKKDPSEWKTGDEPMTGAQHSYLQTLCAEAGIAFEENLTKAQASERIDELRRTNPRTGSSSRRTQRGKKRKA